MKLQGIVSELYATKAVSKEKEVKVVSIPKRKSADPTVGVFAYAPAPKQVYVRSNPIKKIAIVLGVTIGLGMVTFGITKLVAPEKLNVSYKEVVVTQGDTYWGLIRAANPDYKGDIRELVHYAKEVNGDLMAFTTVSIPVVQP